MTFDNVPLKPETVIWEGYGVAVPPCTAPTVLGKEIGLVLLNVFCAWENPAPNKPRQTNSHDPGALFIQFPL